MDLKDIGIEWVLDWNRIVNLIIVLLPFFVTVGGAFKFLLDRSERRETARAAAVAEQRKEEIAASEKRREEAEERQEERERQRDERRQREIDEMNAARATFHGQILSEASRMRELYENELARGLSLRTALAEAAQREMNLQTTIMTLTRKVDELQTQVNQLREELIEKGQTSVI